ncbi:MAG: MlaD family protein [Acidobacteriota bacterium]
MSSERKRMIYELSVGLTVIVALVIVAGAILVLGQEAKLFSRKIVYRTTFPDASGLRVGSPVTMAGLRIGNVSRIHLPTDPASAGIEIFLAVDSTYAPRVRRDTTATPVVMQLVSNEKAIDLTPGSEDQPPLAEGEFITPRIPESLFEKGGTIADRFEDIAADLGEILGAIRSGKGLLGKAIVDPEFGREGLDKLVGTLEEAQTLLRRLARGEGLAGRIVADREYAEQVTGDLAAAIAGLRETTERLARGEGILGQMTSAGEADAFVGDLGRIATALRAIADRLEGGEGLAGRLVADEAWGERVAGNLDETIAHLASITRKIDEGQGTLGLLVNDRKLHDDAQLLIRGVRESRVASWLLRRYHRRGARAAARDAEAAK